MNHAELKEWNDSAPMLHGGSIDGCVYIYALLDPETLDARYVGKTVRPVERLTNHMNERSNCHRSHWLQSLRSRGLRPIMVLLERIHGEWPWQESERHWIAHGRASGWPLTNSTDGGDGVPGLSGESRRRMGAAWRGRRHRPDSIEKMRAASTGRPCSEVTRAKMSATQRGRVIHWVGKVAEALRKFTPEEELAIRVRLANGERVGSLAKEFGVHRTTLSKVKKGVYRGD